MGRYLANELPNGTLIEVENGGHFSTINNNIEDIFEYFREADSESIQDVLDELGEDDYSEENIRLVRIKFFSELGN